MKKNIAELIDELVIANTKIFYLIDKINRNDFTKEEAKKVQDLNMYRSELKNAIREYFGEGKEVKI